MELLIKAFAEGEKVGYTYVSRDGFYDCCVITYNGMELEFPEHLTAEEVEERWKQFR